MALQEVTADFIRRFRVCQPPLDRAWALQCRRYASAPGGSQETAVELESSAFQSSSEQLNAAAQEFDPTAQSRRRRRELPPSRYHFRPPKYDRGPLHPHQSPLTSDPASREYQPGPFTLPRLEQTYNDTFASDLMTLAYAHYPPGTERVTKGERLRTWSGDSPYYKNRPPRGPRGGDVLRLLRKPLTFRNVPKLERVTVHTMVKGAIKESGYLHCAGMVLQAITNVRATAHATQKSVAAFEVRANQYLSLTCELYGEDMYHFLSKVVDVVMPKIKDYRGVKGSSGDNSGNLAFGFTPEEVAQFPEIEVNYDSYPPKLIPGCHVVVHTSATNDRDARMLLTAIGVPFYGKLIN